MRLTTHTDYALRVLMYLALRPGESSTIQEIAESYAISKNHLMKVVQNLGAAGWIETSRGRGGGLRLARPPEAIDLGQVVRTTEEDLALVECFKPEENRCAITPACRLKQIFAEALEAFFQALSGYTLADLVRRPKALARLLELETEARRG
ncbi:MAG: Rrf2 family transcriptional regulator [Kiloniellales bacterium]|nr:Rrf2 family transcriptional regulator [Kiloniellales bacterium]